jgi:hypothetical protein
MPEMMNNQQNEMAEGMNNQPSQEQMLQFLLSQQNGLNLSNLLRMQQNKSIN